MPSFMQISSVIYALLVAIGFLFHVIPPRVMSPPSVVAQEVVAYVDSDDEFPVERATWFNADTDTSWHSLAMMYGHAPEVSAQERLEIVHLFESFDRAMTEAFNKLATV